MFHYNLLRLVTDKIASSASEATPVDASAPFW